MQKLKQSEVSVAQNFTLEVKIAFYESIPPPEKPFTARSAQVAQLTHGPERRNRGKEEMEGFGRRGGTKIEARWGLPASTSRPAIPYGEQTYQTPTIYTKRGVQDQRERRGPNQRKYRRQGEKKN